MREFHEDAFATGFASSFATTEVTTLNTVSDAGASIRACICALICASSRIQVGAMVAEHDRRVHCPTHDGKRRLERASEYTREYARACAFAWAIRCISCVE